MLIAFVVVFAVVGALLLWAQSTGTVPETPSNSAPTSMPG